MRNIKLPFTLMVCFVTTSALAQIDTLQVLANRLTKHRNDVYVEIAKDRTAGNFYSTEAYERFFDKYFTLLNYNRESFTDGNSAEMKLSEDETNLNLTLSRKKGWYIMSIGTSLSLSDNSGSLFSESKPTAGTQFFINNSFLMNRSRWLSAFESYREINYKKRKHVIDSFYTEYAIKIPAMAEQLIADYNRYDAEVIALTQAIEAVFNVDGTFKYPGNAAAEAKLKTDRERVIKATAERDKLVTDLEKIKELKHLMAQEDIKYVLDELTSEAKEMAVQRELSGEGINGVQMSWLSAGASYQRDNYRTYDSALRFSERIGDKAFDKVGLTCGFNWVRTYTASWIEFYKPFISSFFFNANYSLQSGNTYASLDESNLSITRSRISNDTIYQFVQEEKLRDITGEPYKRFWVHKFGVQASVMIKQQYVGLNAVFNTEISEGVDPIYSSRLGVLFRVISSSDEQSKVNFEIFVALDDLTNVGDSKKSVWERKGIGVSTSIPFNKVFFK